MFDAKIFSKRVQQASPAMNLTFSTSRSKYLGAFLEYGGLGGSICLTPRIFKVGSEGLAGDELTNLNFE